MPASEFERDKLELLSHDLADRQSITTADLWDMLRVVFQVPGTARDPFATLEHLGKENCLHSLDDAILMLTDVARQ